MSSPEIYQPAEDSFFLSEILKKIIPKLLNQNKNLKFLEIGCGSGIQLQIALEAGVKKENIFGTDINEEAIKHCKKLDFNCVQSNLFSALKGDYELIVFNPPYLPADKNEPLSSRTSTTGGKKGGEIINKFLAQAKKHLTKDGKIILLGSSLTKGIIFKGYNKKIIAEKNLFFEKLYVWELST
jgi:release factor glutamine methyltransferase